MSETITIGKECVWHPIYGQPLNKFGGNTTLKVTAEGDLIKFEVDGIFSCANFYFSVEKNELRKLIGVEKQDVEIDEGEQDDEILTRLDEVERKIDLVLKKEIRSNIDELEKKMKLLCGQDISTTSFNNY